MTPLRIKAMLDLKFELKDGRQIFLDAFFESKTYAGLLEGSPNASVNRDMLNSPPAIVSRIWPKEPHITLGLDFYSSRLHEKLPTVLCLGQFISYKPASDQKKMGSSLVIIWFQDEIFPLLRDANADWLKDIDWNLLARDFDW
jgi:hypothetical protein